MPKSISQTGLRWRKLDLHVHTPASRDYTGPPITADEFVAKVLAKGVNGIAVTDHNSGEWIDELVAAAKGTELTVFPGVELTVTGGEHGIHIVALFDRDATTKTIENLLSKVGLNAGDYGRLDAISPLGPEAVVTQIHEAGALAILAHADSSKGVLADMRGQQRSRVMNSPHLSAVELTDVSKSARFCSGNDSEYRRKLAYYRASDNPAPLGTHGHSIDGVGDRFSWFKMDGLTLDALRQVYNDPDQRIRCDEESSTIPDRMYPRILTLEASGGFLGGMTFRFHEGLNSIIGGKGVGKSLIIEFLRFALSQPSSIADIDEDMQGKLAQQLGIGGHIVVNVQLEAEQTILVTRTYDGVSNPLIVTYAGSERQVAADIAQLFPILAYSQTETIEIAKDSDAQRRLIDSFLDLTSIEARIAELEDNLAKSDTAIADARIAEAKLDKTARDLATHDEKIGALARALTSQELDALARLQPKSDCMDSIKQFADDIEEEVETLAANLEKCAPPKVPASLTEDMELTRLLDDLSSRTLRIVNDAKALEADVRGLASVARSSTIEWDKVVAAKKQEYEHFVQNQGGDPPKLLARKNALETERPALLAAVQALEERIASIEDLQEQRRSLVSELDAESERRYQLRKRKYDELTAASGGRLELQLIRNGDRTTYLEKLRTLKTGSRLQDATIEQICERVDPRRLLEFVENGDADSLSNEADVGRPSAVTLLNHLGATADIQGVLSLEHGELLKDMPRIRFRKDDGNYYDLKELSVGQKCTALLIIALADGTRPILIDQPEDALDIRSIYEDVTLQLRTRKNSRQFILTTHNPTVAVASDSDQFHVLTATASQAAITSEGAIDRPVVRTAVIQHLEGGPDSFALKSKKYGLLVT